MKTRKPISQSIFLLLSSLFLVCIIAQFFLAGAAIFTNPIHWLHHSSLVHLFGMYLPIIMLLVAAIGKMPSWSIVFTVISLISIFAMYFTANIRGHLPWIASLHPLIGLLLMVIAILLVQKTWKLLKTKEIQS